MFKNDNERFEKIEEIIGELNEEDRKIIRLFYYEDKSIKEISKEKTEQYECFEIIYTMGETILIEMN